jgi:pimeloyl-ACP methyl ester carboxylesterase
MTIHSAAGRPVAGAHYCPASRLSYLDAGAGMPAVVLLHGWGDAKEIWAPTVATLARSRRAVAPDEAGHGGSPLDGARRMSHLAERVALLAETLGLGAFDLVGHSMGGNVALELALTRPELVRRLVLVSPAAMGEELPAYTRLYLHPAAGWAALRASLAIYGRLATLAQHIPPEAELPYAGLLRRSASSSAHDPENLRVMLHGLFDNPLGKRLGAVLAPTLVISGELDLVVPPPLSKRVARAIPGARYVGIPRATHHPMDDRPREFERILTEFLG